ncbi:hypothetical protein H5410_014045 [Solanum commersonii]|uniref:Serine protease EDA2 n=1 Tax=Solanum commersonii TaxID=4109 RepID=A0A9J5ZPU2_SOLCO|nr:hypothetical protein H5410_014045 [Solanum commersonii]
MKQTMLALLIAFFSQLLIISNGISTSQFFLQQINSENKYLTKEEHWFNQTLDHFSPYDHRTFGQRYYEFLDHFRIPDGPIFLKICGESACSGIPNDYLSVLAKKFGAAVVSLEHRYYGKSTPFKSLTTGNLKYLSSKQALFDLAAFRNFYQESLNVKLNRSNIENPWFVFGTSYSGALSAWFRLKFPHLTCGSLASSAVVQAVYSFSEFDKQVGESAGPECKTTLQEITKLVEARLASNPKDVKSLFGADELRNDGDFLYFVADAAVTAFQYGSPDKLCIPLLEAKKSGADLVNAYATYVKDYYVKTFGVSVKTYDQENLKNTVVNGDTSDRLWWFQVCTEVAYFQVAPMNDNTIWTCAGMSLEPVSILMSMQLTCTMEAPKLLGQRLSSPMDHRTPGDMHPNRLLPQMPSYIISCHNCGHGTDMRGCPQSPLVPEGDAKNCSSPDAVRKVREKIVEHIDLWLSQCQVSGRSSM